MTELSDNPRERRFAASLIVGYVLFAFGSVYAEVRNDRSRDSGGSPQAASSPTVSNGAVGSGAIELAAPAQAPAPALSINPPASGVGSIPSIAALMSVATDSLRIMAQSTTSQSFTLDDLGSQIKYCIVFPILNNAGPPIPIFNVPPCIHATTTTPGGSTSTPSTSTPGSSTSTPPSGGGGSSPPTGGGGGGSTPPGQVLGTTTVPVGGYDVPSIPNTGFGTSVLPTLLLLIVSLGVALFGINRMGKREFAS